MATISAIVLFVAAAAFFIYSMMITPRMDRGVSYRPSIQDRTAPKEKDKNAPLQSSNVPPPAVAK